MNWKDTNAGDTEADINNALIYTWVMSLFNIGVLYLWRHLCMYHCKAKPKQDRKGSRKLGSTCVSTRDICVDKPICTI